MREAVEYVRAGIKRYCAMYGEGPAIEGHYVPLDEGLAREIAAAYEALPTTEPHYDTEVAYRALAYEVERQYRFAVWEMHVWFEPWTQAGQPYANSCEMQADVRDHRHLYYFTGGEPHAWLSQEQNDHFRAVHDLFGHAAEGYQFGPRGEENAWVHHSMMFSPIAQRALSTETRGQNSWVNYGPHADLPVTERPYAPQKAALLPERLTDWRAALERQVAE
jgi:hypothetical protein